MPRDLGNGLGHWGPESGQGGGGAASATLAAILAVGAIHNQVLPIDGQVSIQPVLELTVTFDHRVVDGAQGARGRGGWQFEPGQGA